jgi:hypothetical protein
MEPSWIAISIIALIIIVLLFLFASRRQHLKTSNLAILGMSLVVLGIIFGDNRLIGYSFMAVGILISVVDAIRNRKKQ